MSHFYGQIWKENVIELNGNLWIMCQYQLSFINDLKRAHFYITFKIKVFLSKTYLFLYVNFCLLFWNEPNEDFDDELNYLWILPENKKKYSKKEIN